jgi:hypothetical protein
MREDAVREILRKQKTDWQIVEKLLATDELLELEYQRNKYYLRKLHRE